jgi:tetratricopeptide (TPR) repeat protein
MWMNNHNPRIRTLLRQANRVADAGKRAAAEKLYRQIIEEAPQTAEAWAGLGQVVRSEEEKLDHFQRALELDPQNVQAKAGLTGLVEEESIGGENNLKDNENTSASDSLITQKNNDQAINEVIEAGTENESANDASIEVMESTDHEHLAASVGDTEVAIYCANHPKRETSLRCNRCGKPICSTCAQPTPVGYRCPECIREQEDQFFSASALNYMLVVIVTVPLSLIAGWIATFLGFFTIFLGAATGTMIGRIAFRVSGRRRGRWMPRLVSVIVIAGGLLMGLLFVGINFRLIWSGIYIITASGAAYYQMR